MKYLFFPAIKTSARTAKTVCCLFLAALVFNGFARAQQQDTDVISGWVGFTDAKNALYNYFLHEADAMLVKRKAEVEALSTLSDWKQRQQKVRKTLLDIVGPFPKRTPLNAKVTGAFDKGDYRIENILYESQPGFYVSSSLFIPAGLKGKAPVIIFCSGHTAEGYRTKAYLHMCINLVKKGFVVFAFDPVEQGERVEHVDEASARAGIGSASAWHSYGGAQAFIAGASQAMYMIWDGIRAIDYVITRKEVDPARIGITGRSGGGTQSAYIAAIDERVYAAAPESYITSFSRLMNTIAPQDAEQNFTHEIARGIDHADFLEVRAPKPTLVISPTRDFFSIQGARESVKEASAVFKAYNKEENLGMAEDDEGHASTEKNRMAMYAFFQKHLQNPGSNADLNTEELTKEIQVTPTGQIHTSIKDGETIFTLNRKLAQQHEERLNALRKEPAKYLPAALSAAKKLSGYHAPGNANQPAFAGRTRKSGGYVMEKYFIKGYGDYAIPYVLMIPDNPNNKALIYLNSSGKAAEAGEGGEIESLVQQGFTVLAPDLLGIGETSSSGFRGDSFIKGLSYNIWFSSILVNRSIVGLRAGDVVRLAQVLKSNKAITDVYALADNELAPVLLHAAAFDKNISRIALIEPYTSYQSIVYNRFYSSRYVYSSVAGALKAYDLPDLAASLAPRKLSIVNMKDGEGKAVDAERANEEYGIVRSAYAGKNAVGQLNIVIEPSKKGVAGVLRSWAQ